MFVCRVRARAESVASGRSVLLVGHYNLFTVDRMLVPSDKQEG